jgi:hypothetical protein
MSSPPCSNSSCAIIPENPPCNGPSVSCARSNRAPMQNRAVAVGISRLWANVELTLDMGHSVMIFVGTKEVPPALEANVAHGPEDSIYH